MKPQDMTHIETDGTFWKNDKGQWYFYNPHFKKWYAYVGKVNQGFLQKLTEVSLKT